MLKECVVASIAEVLLNFSAQHKNMNDWNYEAYTDVKLELSA